TELQPCPQNKGTCIVILLELSSLYISQHLTQLLHLSFNDGQTKLHNKALVFCKWVEDEVVQGAGS
ncbi:hypothetical protein Tsubulata_050557, partial [Turnera subulata]